MVLVTDAFGDSFHVVNDWLCAVDFLLEDVANVRVEVLQMATNVVEQGL